MLDAVSTGLHPSAVVGQLAGKYGVSERCLWSDWERRAKWVPLLLSLEKFAGFCEMVEQKLNALPKDKEGPFKSCQTNLYRNFESQRKKLANKLQNPRLLRITFHTFRHWKATMEYHKTKDILHVMQLLGHRNIKNTLVYTQLVNFESDDYHSATARTVEEARKLVETGFEYACTHDDIMLFRKRK